MTANPAIYAKYASPHSEDPHVFSVVTTQRPRELADRCACLNAELGHGCTSPIRRVPQSVVGTPSPTRRSGISFPSPQRRLQFFGGSKSTCVLLCVRTWNTSNYSRGLRRVPMSLEYHKRFLLWNRYGTLVMRSLTADLRSLSLSTSTGRGGETKGRPAFGCPFCVNGDDCKPGRRVLRRRSLSDCRQEREP